MQQKSVSEIEESSSEEITLKEISDDSKKVFFSKKVEEKKDDKGPKEENTNALKEALAEALKKKEEIVKVEKPAAKIEQKPSEPKNSFASAEKKDKKLEIPERELKDILGVE